MCIKRVEVREKVNKAATKELGGIVMGTSTSAASRVKYFDIRKSRVLPFIGNAEESPTEDDEDQQADVVQRKFVLQTRELERQSISHR